MSSIIITLEEDTLKRKLVLLSGPSCVGKGPMRAALADLYPGIRFAVPVWYHSRRPRLKKATGRYEVHGIDYYFVTRSVIEGMDPDRFITGRVHETEIQALDTAYLLDLFAGNDIVFTEIYHTFLGQMAEWVERQDTYDIELRSVFLTPMAEEEVARRAAEKGISPDEAVYEVMIEKQKRRGEDPPDKLEERARGAYAEMRHAHRFTDVIVNHAGEDDIEEWGRPPGPEASRVVAEFAAVFG